MKNQKTPLLWVAVGVIALLNACSASVTYTKAVNDPAPSGPATTITLTPKSGRVAPGAGFSFAAMVQNAPDANSSYRLTVDEGLSGGTFDSYTGQYLAPWVPGTYHITATSSAVPSVTDHGTVTVMAGGSLIGPSKAILPANRAGHTATLLQDGRILIAGGSVPGYVSYFNSTLFYDPAANGGFGSITPGPTMTQARYRAASVRLKDGRVLICGGGDFATGATAEIFDPATGLCTPTGDMHFPRSGHEALLLDSGLVLIVDGYRTEWLEYFDPAQGKFFYGPMMPSARASMAVTKLKNGDVLLAGGYDGHFPILSETLIFSASNWTISPGPALTAGREVGQATLLPDGRVLISGGYLGTDFQVETTATEIGTPDASGRIQSFAAGPNLDYGRGPYAVFTPLADGTFLVTGGGTNGYGARSETAIFNPATTTFSAGPRFALPRCLHSATAIPNGRVIVIGGYGSGYGMTNTIEVYYP